MPARKPHKGLASRALLALAAVAALALPAASAAAAVLPTNAADTLRTGWYPDEPRLAPATVSGSSFDRLFSTPVQGQVYAQPLVWDDTLLVVTEENHVYGLDPVSGAQRWHRSDLGTPFDPREVECADLVPWIGITGTPTIDPATDRAYFTAKSVVAGRPRYDLHAVDVATGREAPGFPVQIRGSADNNPGVPFDARYQLQRPGLLLLDGVVYMGFGGHCDNDPYQGWIVGIDAASGQTKARWIANATGEDGAGIWQSGGGLVSDAPGEILITTGNGDAPSDPTPGSDPPDGLGETVTRLRVQPDGTLQPVDFFAPYDAAILDQWDADFGSTPPTVLPRPYFADRDLVVAAGKTGYAYLFDSRDLGGIRQSPLGGDKVLQKLGPLGGAWTRFGVWPGDGGWLYYPTAASGMATSGEDGRLIALDFGVDGDGEPRLSKDGQAGDVFGFGSGAPVVTSDGTRHGSALVWIIRTPGASGFGAELRAYDPVPVGGTLQLRRSFPIGQSSKFAPPGIFDGRVYVGARDGHVLGFGVPATVPLEGSAPDFPTTVVGVESDPLDVVLTATAALTISNVSTIGPFGHSPASRTTLARGDTVTVPVTFTPNTFGPIGGTLRITTSLGDVDVGLSGTGLEAAGTLVATRSVVGFEAVAPGQTGTDAVTLKNVGATPVSIDAVTLPSAPFAASGIPRSGQSIATGGEVTFTVSFSPAAPGLYSDEVAIDSDDGEGPLRIGLTGVSATPAHLAIDPFGVDFGGVLLGTSATRSFRVENTGGAPATITKSKPPVLGAFQPAAPGVDDGNPLPEGVVVAGGAAVDVPIRFTPSALAPFADGWILNATDDGGGVRTIAFAGSGATAPPAGDGDDGDASRGAAGGRPSFAARALRPRAGRGAAAVRVRCPSTAPAPVCRGRLALHGSRSGRGRLRLLGNATFAIRRGRSARVTVPLSRWARGVLAGDDALRGRATLRTRDALGRLATSDAPLTLLPPR